MTLPVAQLDQNASNHALPNSQTKVDASSSARSALPAAPGATQPARNQRKQGNPIVAIGGAVLMIMFFNTIATSEGKASLIAWVRNAGVAFFRWLHHSDLGPLALSLVIGIIGFAILGAIKER